MALERAREYELRQRQFEQQAVRFYRLAYHLLATKGGMFTHVLSGSYPMHVAEDGEGGGIRYEQYSQKIPYLVFGATLANDQSEASTVILSATALSKRDFKKYPEEITQSQLYENGSVLYPSFDLHVARGGYGTDLIMYACKHVLRLNVGECDPNDNSISLYGKEFLKNGQFNLGVPTEAFEEFDELVDLTKLLSADPDSYKKIYPKPKAPKLDKAHA